MGDKQDKQKVTSRSVWIGICLAVTVTAGGYVLLGKSDLAQVPAQAKEYHFTGEVL